MNATIEKLRAAGFMIELRDTTNERKSPPKRKTDNQHGRIRALGVQFLKIPNADRATFCAENNITPDQLCGAIYAAKSAAKR